MLIETAYAKINLALHVRRRRADGYHDIESLFAFATDGDVLFAQARQDSQISLSIDGPFATNLSSGPDNLVIRAAEALREGCGVTKGADIYLTKNLPVASGIGGGSADAAAALRLLTRVWQLTFAVDPQSPHPECGEAFAGSARENIDGLVRIAASLGSDVPACVVSDTLVGTGRGEALDLRAIAGLSHMCLLLVNPGRGLSTAEVFANWDGLDRGPLSCEGLEQIIVQGRNDLQEPAIELVPEIAEVLARLEALDGLVLARMSGSGATCFALISDEAALVRGARSLQRAHPEWWVMTSRVR